MVFWFYKAEAASLCFPFRINKCAPAISAACCMHLLCVKRKQSSKWFPNQFTSSQMQAVCLSLSLELHFRTACPVLFKGEFLQLYPKKPFQITPSDARGDVWLHRATFLPCHRHCFQHFVLGGRCEVQIMASTMASTTECLSNHLLGFLVGFGTLGRCVRRTDCCLPSQSGLQKRVLCEGASKLCFSLGEDARTLVSGLSRAGRDSAQPLPTQETSAILPLPCKCGFTVHFFHKLSIVICGPLFIPMWCSRCYVLCSHPLPNNRRKCVFM